MTETNSGAVSLTGLVESSITQRGGMREGWREAELEGRVWTDGLYIPEMTHVLKGRKKVCMWMI